MGTEGRSKLKFGELVFRSVKKLREKTDQNLSRPECSFKWFFLFVFTMSLIVWCEFNPHFFTLLRPWIGRFTITISADGFEQAANNSEEKKSTSGTSYNCKILSRYGFLQTQSTYTMKKTSSSERLTLCGDRRINMLLKQQRYLHKPVWMHSLTTTVRKHINFLLQ